MKKADFKEIWVVDFEFAGGEGDPQHPVCLVAREIRTTRQLRIWRDELIKMKSPPYALDGPSLFVAYFASAELGCHLVLNWPFPEKVLDLYAEFRNHTNGTAVPCGEGLLGAMVYYGLSSIDAAKKK